MNDLLKWVTPEETALDFLSRQRREALATGLPFIDSQVKLRPGHVLEIVGPTSSAKTEILIEVAANVLSRDVGSQNSSEQGHVVVFDCDGKFDFIRFIQVLTARLPAQGSSGPVPDVLGALQRIHLVRCSDTLDLLLALNMLHREQATWQGPCRLLLLDNISAFVWQDRAAAGSSTTHLQQQAMPVDALRNQAAVAALLRELSQGLRCPVIVTKQTGVSQDDRQDGSKLIQRELLSNAWQSIVTHRLLLLPALPPGQALATLIQGPRHTEILMQWQVGD
eukprot:GHUV01026887.1.p1 GENE.GHUV01026887.1~~GHUV01026887.1.p1  ORF type:complete len:279 (+),score=47.88 GHUV01026887.1:217-1053(+)